MRVKACLGPVEACHEGFNGPPCRGLLPFASHDDQKADRETYDQYRNGKPRGQACKS